MKTTSGYRLVLPPGWVQVPVRDEVPGTAHEVISTAFKKPPDGIPRDAFTSARIELERRLEQMISKAKANGGLEKLHMAFYQDTKMKDSEPWHFWRIEGPGFVWNFRVLPHVHTYVNISSNLA